jgi:hypothetical protein
MTLNRLRLIPALLVLAFLLGSPPRAVAQLAGPDNITAQDAGACATAGACVSYGLGTNATFTIDISGTFTGTLTFEGTVNGVDWRTITVTSPANLSLATTATAGGSWTVSNVGLQAVRLRAGTFTGGGTAIIYGRRGYMLALRAQPTPAASGVRFLCINTAGLVVSQAAACSGT